MARRLSENKGIGTNNQRMDWNAFLISLIWNSAFRFMPFFRVPGYEERKTKWPLFNFGCSDCCCCCCWKVEVFLQSLTSVILHSVHMVGRHHRWTVLLLLVRMQRDGRTLAQVGRHDQIPRHVRIVRVRVVLVTPVTPGVTPRVTSNRVHPVQRILSHIWRRHSLLFLPPIAEPDPYDFFLQLKAVS